MSTVRAKFKVTSLTEQENGLFSVKLQPVTSGSLENEQFFKYTPYGAIEMGTINKAGAENFKPGAQFYVDFTPAE